MSEKPENMFRALSILGTGKREWNIVNGLGGNVERFRGSKEEAERRASYLESLKRAGKPYYGVA